MKYNRLFWGLILIVIGVLFLLHQTGKINLEIGFLVSLWPIIIIYYCLKGLFLRRNYMLHGWNGSVLWNLFGLCIGLYFLGRNFDYINISIGQLVPYAIPILLIIFGMHMIFKPRKDKTDWKSKMKEEWKAPETDSYDIPDMDEPDFAGEDYKSNGHNNYNTMNKSSFIGDVYMGQDYWELQPLNISHFIGDTVLDLTKAQIPYGETKITVSAFIGDVKIFIPNDIELEVSVINSSFLGDSIVFERKEGGMFNNMKIESRDYQIADKRIRIIISMFIGDLRVQRIG